VSTGGEPPEWLAPGACYGLSGAKSLEPWCRLALALCFFHILVFLDFFLLLIITHLFGFLEQSF